VHNKSIHSETRRANKFDNAGASDAGQSRCPRSPGSRRGLVCDSPHKSPERKRRDPRRTPLTSS
jgi:hypothetical protein